MLFHRHIVTAIVAGIGAAMCIPGGASALEIAAGASGGLSVASLIGSNAVPGDGWEDKVLYGYNGGAVFVVDFSRVFGVEVDCIFNNKGVKAIQNSGGGAFTRQYAYVDLPVMARFILTIESGAPIRQSFCVGPCFSILWNARETTAGTGTSSDGTVDTKDEMEPLDIGAVVGFAVEIEAGPGRLVFDIRYNQGFYTLDTAEDIRTSVIGVNLGYVFSLFSRY
jgi:hypothetical protein